MDHTLDIMTDDRMSLGDQLCEQDGRLKDRIELDDGVALIPQFTTVDTQRAVGGADILAFVISIPIGIVTSVAANLIYSWLTANKIKKVRLDALEVIVTEDKDETIRLLIGPLDQQNGE